MSAPQRWAAWRLACVASIWGWAGAAAAQPEAIPIWGYVDTAGVAHLAGRQLDSRYVPVFTSLADKAPWRVAGKTHLPRHLLTWLEFAPEVKAVQPWLREAERQTGVDMELLKAVIVVESGFDSRLVSPRGAVGLMQLMPDTGSRYALGADAADKARPAPYWSQRLREPQLNIMTGARMLADLKQRWGGYDLALAAWNAGEGTLRRHGGQFPPITETRAHVQLVLELYWVLLQQRHQQQAQSLNLDMLPR